MNSFLFGVLLLFVVILVDFSCADSSPQLGEGNTSKLEATDHKLANVSLPVWIVSKNGTLQLMEHVVEMISPFDMYQDPVNSAAAVIFHIPLDSNESNISHRSDDDDESEDSYEMSNVDYTATRYGKRSELTSMMKTELNTESNAPTVIRRAIQDPVYIEILVFVNYDLANELKTKPNEYSSILIHVLTLFNNVDVLFAKVKDPIIKINLAGIIIGDSAESSYIYVGGKCYKRIRNFYGKYVDDIDAHCANEFLRNFCHEHKAIIPSGTYDIAVLLTRYGLHQHINKSDIRHEKPKRVKGLAELPSDNYYELMEMGVMPTLVATVSDKGEYESFTILAYEIAYLIGVDPNESIDEMHKKMQPNGKHSASSLSWTPTSLQSMKKFFSSRNSCIFKNEPGSLRTQGPHKIWDVDQQCQCYGYESARAGILNESPGNIGINCDEKIKCNDENKKLAKGPILMDGTPCGDNKVCWGKKCVDIIT